MICVECIYCRGSGCEECAGTGERYTTLVRVGDASAIVHGSAPLTAAHEEAIAVVLRAAFDLMGEDLRNGVRAVTPQGPRG